MGTHLLQTHRVSKRFKRQTVVDEVSLAVREGTVYGLLGPNGAGKTTLLKMIAGLLHPTGGKILYDGKPWNRKSLEQIGSLIEAPALYGNLTARENLKVHTMMLGLPEGRIEEVLETVDLAHTGKKRASQFSLGMKQRLGIAIALLKHPRLLILDEPTNGLDPIGIQDLRQLIRSFPAQGITVLLSSHALNEVEQIVDDIGIISGGKLRYQNRLDERVDLESLFIEVVRETSGEASAR
ncbi:lantibiotic protection ABC transporter ATP-binding protein [Aneurinibacillus thermoaerophilus]|uniref:lantibiotic protection ABC transporter ATP-binding protein n=1 Tax=Aneurinibacillus thermoaerophilus TaxID=143495 RepID=UPI002E1E3ECB|nr:lantibiotic protection ABC transporter ATP-binding protein [Aneurinibacillus thermoaerophilus]MED0762947.1 lantibiotic protection ABC transporter ATP-binding protein [Aneurinibacillus thermoaerophilus]